VAQPHPTTSLSNKVMAMQSTHVRPKAHEILSTGGSLALKAVVSMNLLSLHVVRVLLWFLRTVFCGCSIMIPWNC
jgi:hypothetical protein